MTFKTLMIAVLVALSATAAHATSWTVGNDQTFEPKQFYALNHPGGPAFVGIACSKENNQLHVRYFTDVPVAENTMADLAKMQINTLVRLNDGPITKFVSSISRTDDGHIGFHSRVGINVLLTMAKTKGSISFVGTLDDTRIGNGNRFSLQNSKKAIFYILKRCSE